MVRRHQGKAPGCWHLGVPPHRWQIKWTESIEVANGIQFTRTDGKTHRHPCWNPVLFQPKKGPLLLFYKVGPDPENWWGMLIRSEDHGKTWSNPQRLPEGIIGPVKNRPLQLPDGSIMASLNPGLVLPETMRLTAPPCVRLMRHGGEAAKKWMARNTHS